MKQSHQNEIVVEEEDGRPVFVTLPSTRRFPVVVVDAWRQTDDYWNGSPEQDCFRVERDEEGFRGQMVIARETESRRWSLMRVFD